MKRVVLALLAGCAISTVAAEIARDAPQPGVSEVLLEAMTDEMKRTVAKLRLEQLAAPYFVAQTVEEQRVLSMEGSFGSIVRPRLYEQRTLKLELRVGSREFDDNHFVSTDVRAYPPMTGRIPVEDDYDALRFEIWSLTDRAYKRALERLSKKEAYRQRKNITELVPDLSEDEVQVFRKTSRVAPFDQAAWERRVRELSAVFREYPRIQTSYVRLEFRTRHHYFVDSEGRSVVNPAQLFEIRIGASGQAEDGMEQKDELRILRRTLDRMPERRQLETLTRGLAESVTALIHAPQAETYLGPVLLEGQAAGEFFNQLLASGVSHARSPWIESEWVEQYFKPGSLVGRIGLRVISPFFDAYDDPTLAEYEGQELIGHYQVDDQGIRAQRVGLINRGILEDVLMSRSPTKKRNGSNGHGRGALHEPADARIASLFLAPTKTVPFDQLNQKLRQEANAFGLDHGLVIRRIEDESKRERGELLSAPVMVYRVDVATGEEQLLRDARFHSVTLRALRDIVVASSEMNVYNLRKRGSAYFRGSSPSSIVHPSVLLAEMELMADETEPESLPYLEHPHFAGKKRKGD
jgi:hypothetical protein